MVANVSQPSNDAASRLDTIGTPPVPTCPIAREVGPSEAEPAKVKEPRRPTFARYPALSQYGQPGLYYHGQRQPRARRRPGPLRRVDMQPHRVPGRHRMTSVADNHGPLLRFKSPYGPWRQWAMPPAAAGKGSGEEMRGELLDMGVRINPDGFRRCTGWASQCRPDEVVVAATRVGLAPRRGGAGIRHAPAHHFALVASWRVESPSKARWPAKTSTPPPAALSWREAIGRFMQRQPAGRAGQSPPPLAGPPLHLCHRPTAGIHLVGDSSCGKPLGWRWRRACGVVPTSSCTWRATGNGLEGVAAALSDTALVLDDRRGRWQRDRRHRLRLGQRHRQGLAPTATAPPADPTAGASRYEQRRAHPARPLREAGKRPPRRGGPSGCWIYPPTSPRRLGMLHHLADGRAFLRIT